ncbi:hypothetical protein [Acuticoccus kandeliae]|uniref:hypothetical protein n=1 Tax=Acuticoccus kandeliae TaxID=2073160 RepID=UPI0013007EEE|nr:hypothetical protein [Acuticoccus kandeliae]
MTNLSDLAFQAATLALADDFRRVTAERLEALGLTASPEMEGEMSIAVEEFASEAIVWLGGVFVAEPDDSDEDAMALAA